MDIRTRHIRKDWPEWVDWQTQSSVRTMCGVRSRPGLSGIPGVTQQKLLVEHNGGKAWGWCSVCVRRTFPYYLPSALDENVTAPEILTLHERAREFLAPQYRVLLMQEAKRFAEGSVSRSAVMLDVRKLEDEYGFEKITAPLDS